MAIDYGVKGVTHRRVAAEAGVALGSASYHYEHIDALMFEAFSSWIRSQTVLYVPDFDAARSDADVIAAVKKLLTVIHGSEDARILLFEIYAQSVRDPQYHELVGSWSRDTRASLERLYTPETARAIEAVWEGFGVQLVMGAVHSISEVEPLLLLVLEREPAGSIQRARRTRSR